jgi:hypothetical protein
MQLRRNLPVLLAALAACAQPPSGTGVNPQPIVPRNGPVANVRVEYDGGIFNRRLAALFRVERPAYVLVAHLAGDGTIRILFPEDARESGWVRGGRTYRTDMVSGDYDAAPGFWFMRPPVFRSAGAQNASYDGNGHGFVFMIASSLPLRFERISAYGIWDELEIPGYENTRDPRLQIREFANRLSPNGRYTLDYASSFSTYRTYSYASSSLDCALLSSAGFGFYSPWYFSSRGFGGLCSRDFRSCGSNRYFSYAYFDYYSGLFGRPVLPPVVSSTPERPPTTEPVNRIPRPGRRDPITTRTAFSAPVSADRGTDLSGRRSFAPGRRTDGERVYPAPSTPFRGAFGPRTSVTGATDRRADNGSASTGSSRPSSTPTASSGGSSGSGGSTGGSPAPIPRPEPRRP